MLPAFLSYYYTIKANKQLYFAESYPSEHVVYQATMKLSTKKL